MKALPIASILMLALLNSCDQIDTVTDKVNDLKSLREKASKAAAGAENSGPAIQELADTDFQTFISQEGTINIVSFHADWCGACKQLEPILSEVVTSNKNVARLGKINVDNARKLAEQQGVRGIPDVRFYVDGKLVDKFTGAAPKKTIEELVAKHSSGMEPDEEPTQAAPADSSETPDPDAPVEKIKPMPKDWLPPGMSKG